MCKLLKLLIFSQQYSFEKNVTSTFIVDPLLSDFAFCSKCLDLLLGLPKCYLKFFSEFVAYLYHYFIVATTSTS